MENYEIVVKGEPVELRRCGDYIAASDGKIYNMNWHKTGKFKEVKQSKRTEGYWSFRFNGKYVLSHRFLAACFIPNPYNLPQVNHKNEVKSDNRVENLEWCDAKYNINYGSHNKRVAISKSKPILQFTKDGEFVAKHPSSMEVKRRFGFDNSHITACCLGKQKSAYGFIWRYVE